MSNLFGTTGLVLWCLVLASPGASAIAALGGAAGTLCDGTLAGHAAPAADGEGLLKVLGELSTEPESTRFREARNLYKELTRRSDAQVEEDIAMAALMAQAGHVNPALGSEQEAELAFGYVREHTLRLPAALMKAITEDDIATVRGLLVIAQRGDEICRNVPGYQRFCKALVVEAGWEGKSFLLEAAKVDAQIAALLIQAVSPALLHQEVLVKLTDLIALTPSASVDATIKLALDVGLPATAQDLKRLIVDHRTDLSLEVLRLHPELATEDAAVGDTPLLLAIRQGDVALVDALLATKRINVNEEIGGKAIALFEAIALDDMQIFERLLDAGADVHQTNRLGLTLIHAAILKPGAAAFRDYVKELILAGVDLNARTTGAVKVVNDANFSREAQFSAGLTALQLAIKLREGPSLSAVDPGLRLVEKMLANNGAK